MVEYERRAEFRIRPQGIRVEFPELQPRLRDLSLSGAYIEDPRPLSRGRMLRVQLSLPDNVTVTIRAMVRRVDDGKGMSVEFLEMSRSDRTHLREFIRVIGQAARPQSS